MKKYFISFLIFCFLLPLTSQAEIFGEEGDIMKNLGQTLTAAGFSEGQQAITVEQIAINIINVTLSLFGIIFVILLIYGGWLWMTAAGNEQQIDQAKKTIKRTVIGLTIILSSLSISLFISRSLLTATGVIK